MVELWSRRRSKKINYKLVKNLMMVTSKCMEHQIKIKQQTKKFQADLMLMTLTPRLPHQAPSSLTIMVAISMVSIMSYSQEFP